MPLGPEGQVAGAGSGIDKEPVVVILARVRIDLQQGLVGHVGQHFSAIIVRCLIVTVTVILPGTETMQQAIVGTCIYDMGTCRLGGYESIIRLRGSRVLRIGRGGIELIAPSGGKGGARRPNPDRAGIDDIRKNTRSLAHGRCCSAFVAAVATQIIQANRTLTVPAVQRGLLRTAQTGPLERNALTAIPTQDGAAGWTLNRDIHVCDTLGVRTH